MLIIGLTGGIASGKSAIAAELANHGAVVLNADAGAHRVINYPEVKQLLTQRWGPAALKPDGTVDRRAVAARVFGPDAQSAEDREFLENALHPRIRQEFEQELVRLQASGVPAAVIDAPLLLEAGWEEICDVVLFVDTPREDCLRRAQLSRNWTPEDFASREAAQMPIEEKRRRATHTIRNGGSLAELAERVRVFWESVTTRAKSS